MRSTKPKKITVATKLLLLYFLLFVQLHVYSQATTNMQSGFVLMQQEDTISVERFSKKEGQLQSRLLYKNQYPVVYHADISKEQLFKKLEIKVLSPGAANGEKAKQAVSLVFKQNNIYTTTQENGTIKKDSVEVSSDAMAYHLQLPMLLLLEQIVKRAFFVQTRQASSTKQLKIPLYLMNTKGKVADARVSFPHADSVHLSIGDFSVRLQVNKSGEIMAGSTSEGQTIKRVAHLPQHALTTKAPDYSPPADAPYKAEEVRIKTKAGHTLAGTLTLPENSQHPLPLLITISGSSPQTRDHSSPYDGRYHLFRQIADTMGRSGIAVLRMDDRGVGQSTGDLSQATTAERAQDIRECLAYAKKHAAIDSNNIVLLGLSEGAIIAPMIARDNPQLSGMVLMAAPASTGKQVLRYQLRAQLSASAQEKEDSLQQLVNKKMQEVLKKAEKDPWLRYFLEYDPLKTASKVKQVPVLILQGTADKQVPPGDAQKLAKAFREAGNQEVAVITFQNFNHIFLHDPDGNPKKYQELDSFKVPRQVISPIVNWVLAVTGKK